MPRCADKNLGQVRIIGFFLYKNYWRLSANVFFRRIDQTRENIASRTEWAPHQQDDEPRLALGDPSCVGLSKQNKIATVHGVTGLSS
jgi:hypothetical protein